MLKYVFSVHGSTGAAVEAQNAQQTTPLHLAAQKGHAEVCRVLMEAGAAVGAQAAQQYTPLHVSAQYGHAEVCRVLMEAGAAVDARNVQQFTPLYLAAQSGHVEVCRILMKARAAVDARNHQQCTPLHFAAINGHDSTSMLLVFEGADLTAPALPPIEPRLISLSTKAMLPSRSICAAATVPTAFAARDPPSTPALLLFGTNHSSSKRRCSMRCRHSGWREWRRAVRMRG
jgi:hypothetical protein